MLHRVIIKDFKKKELERSINSILFYNSILKFKLLNFSRKQLLFYLFYLSRYLNSLTYNAVGLNFNVQNCQVWGDLLGEQLNVSSKLVVANTSDFLKLYHKTYIFKNLIIKLLFLNSIRSVNLRKKSSIETLLRSPHTDKKSREQFRKVEYRKLVSKLCLISNDLLKLIIKKEWITSKLRSRYSKH